MVCRELKLNPITKKIPVIFLTAKGRGEDIFEGLRIGAVSYVLKPYDADGLLDKIRHAL